MILLAALFALTPLISETPVVTRAALDLGSGKFKLLVGDVQGKKVHIRFSKMIISNLGHDYAANPDQMLSLKTQKIALEALQELKKIAEEQGAREFRGIATEIFRKAKNGEELLSRLVNETGIPLQIVSQEKEGILGFNTAVALSTLEEKNIISWDSGNASFQIVAKNGGDYLVYEGPLGGSRVTKAFVEEVRKAPYIENTPINPITLTECEALIRVIQDKIAPPAWLKDKLEEMSVVSIGGDDCIFGIASRAIGNNRFTIDQVRDIMKNMAGSSSAELKRYVLSTSSESVLTRVVLLYSVMDKFGIQEVTYHESTGSTLGLLIDDEMWTY